MTTNRKCGHPLGDTRWCPDCELSTASSTSAEAGRAAAPSVQARADEILALRRRHNASGQDGRDMPLILASLGAAR